MRNGGRFGAACGWVLVVALVSAGACTASPEVDREPGARSSSSPPPSPVALDGLAAAGIQATRVVPDVGAGPGWYLDLNDTNDNLVAAGDRLIARMSDERSGADWLVASADLGRTWRSFGLPGATPDDTFALLKQVGPTVVATSGGKTDSVWLTTDGVVWRGGPAPVEPDGYLLARPVRQPDGAVVVGLQGKNDERLVLTSDGGATFRAVDCPPVARGTDPHSRCVPVAAAGGPLWVRTYEVSVDAGKTWQPVRIVPDPGVTVIPIPFDPVALPGGGWLTPVMTGTASARTVFLLVRSTDGLSWQTVIPYPCEQAGDRSSAVSSPQALGDRWLVAYTCTTAADDALRSMLYLVDRDGTNARVLATIDEPGRWFGAPVTVGGTVVVPEIRSDGRGGRSTVTLLHLRA